MSDFHNRISHYFECLQNGNIEMVAELQKEPFMKVLPQLSVLRPHLNTIYTFGAPLLRDELRQPHYAKILFVYAAEKSLYFLPSNLRPLHKVYKKGFVTGILHFQHILLCFWLIHVRRRIRHWRKSYTFSPVPPFQSGQDTILNLTRRNPRFVPNAISEFTRAIRCCSSEIYWERMERWVQYCVDRCAYHALTTLVSSLIAKEKYTPLFCLLLMQCIPCVSKRILKSLEKTPEQYHGDLQQVLLLFLRDSLHPTTVQQVLRLYHKVVCRSPADLYILVKEGGLERYVGNASIVKDFIDLFLNPQMWMSMRISRHPFAVALCATKRMETFVNRLTFRASKKICHFMEKMYLRIKTIRAVRTARIQTYMHQFKTLLVRWRWRKAWLLRQDCIVCWESGLLLKPLHREWRHAICVECLAQIEDTCPICRTSLLQHTPMVRERTLSDASSVSYTSNYEDPYYDDDQIYHY